MPTLEGRTGNFRIASVAGVDKQLRLLVKHRDRCYRQEPGYPMSLLAAYRADIDLLLDARRSLANAREVDTCSSAP